jgi:hypothetical protein
MRQQRGASEIGGRRFKSPEHRGCQTPNRRNLDKRRGVPKEISVGEIFPNREIGRTLEFSGPKEEKYPMSGCARGWRACVKWYQSLENVLFFL